MLGFCSRRDAEGPSCRCAPRDDTSPNINITATDVTSLSELGCVEVVEGTFTIRLSVTREDVLEVCRPWPC